MRVGGDIVQWDAENGTPIVFDDSFNHEVWYDESSSSSVDRVVLLFDVWHPDITMQEREAIVDMFQSTKG